MATSTEISPGIKCYTCFISFALQREALIIPILWIGKLRQGKIEQGHSACKSHRQGLNLDRGISQVRARNQFTHLPLPHPLPDQGAVCSCTWGEGQPLGG